MIGIVYLHVHAIILDALTSKLKLQSLLHVSQRTLSECHFAGIVQDKEENFLGSTKECIDSTSLMQVVKAR